MTTYTYCYFGFAHKYALALTYFWCRNEDLFLASKIVSCSALVFLTNGGGNDDDDDDDGDDNDGDYDIDDYGYDYDYIIRW